MGKSRLVPAHAAKANVHPHLLPAVDLTSVTGQHHPLMSGMDLTFNVTQHRQPLLLQGNTSS